MFVKLKQHHMTASSMNITFPYVPIIFDLFFCYLYHNRNGLIDMIEMRIIKMTKGYLCDQCVVMKNMLVVCFSR